MIDLWPEDWRTEIGATFDAERGRPPEIRVLVVAGGGCYTGDVWHIRPGEPGRMEHDQKLAGRRAVKNPRM